MASANAYQLVENPWNLCLERTRAEERSRSIPEHLLTAISLAESGRWSSGHGENLAWPWTVTAGGQGRFLPTKAAAIAEVQALRARGVSNIDVGCMQVNLRYHPGAFAGLEEAFDPASNVAYAATHLERLFDAAGSWQEAAADYHSTTPEFHDAYHAKVVRLWGEQQRKPATLDPEDDAAENGPQEDEIDESVANGQAAAGRPAAPRIVPVDYARTARLNASFRGLRSLERSAPGTSLRDHRLASLEEASALMRGQPATATQHRIDVERQRHLTAQTAAPGTNGQNFADRRREQLRDWRTRVAGNGSW